MRKDARVIYPGVDVDAYRPRGGSPLDHPVIGTASRLVPVKSLATLLRTFALIRARDGRTTLEIAGEGPERPLLEAEAQRLGVFPHCRFLGWQADVAALHRRWAVFVQPSLAEGFGVAALEAMASGLPVVATRVGGLEELVVDGVTGYLVPPENPQALAGAVRAVLGDPGLAVAMGAAGRARVQMSFTAERMVHDILDLYSTLLSRRH
jgi:glycosyltransferase involved in cell wall biosynthesis